MTLQCLWLFKLPVFVSGLWKLCYDSFSLFLCDLGEHTNFSKEELISLCIKPWMGYNNLKLRFLWSFWKGSSLVSSLELIYLFC